MEDGTYELSYVLPFEGQYELSMKMFERPISGSPFKVPLSFLEGASNVPPPMGLDLQQSKMHFIEFFIVQPRTAKSEAHFMQSSL